MANAKENHWTELWKKEDWIAVWAGFFIILLILGGLTLKMPSFKWTTDGEMATYLAKTAPAVDKIGMAAAEKGEPAIQAQAAVLQTAIASGDRKVIGDEAKKLGDLAKDAKDEGIKKKAAALAKDVSGQAGALPGKVFSGANIMSAVYIFIIFLILSLIAFALMGDPAIKAIGGFLVVFILAWIAQFIAGSATVNYYGVEYVIWCLLLGLIISNVFGVPDWLTPAVRTEFYIKTGLVILGAGILFGEIVQAGAYGIVQALIVVGVVWYFCFWIAKKLGVDDDFAAIISSAVSICGVSAAIATSGAIKGDPKKLSYTTSIVLICAVPMLILMPIIARYFGMPDVVAGAWLGGTLDTSGSVVAAGALISETAMKTGVIVKMSQNVLIGVAAFILAIVWTLKGSEGVPGADKPTAMEIWYRFPKFVLGFIIASVVFSFLLNPEIVNTTKGALAGLRTWWFALAFTCIGLDTKFSELAKLGGGRPALAFVIAQVFNIFWTLLLAYLIFGGVFVAAPKL
jgi:uncharacterized integral membrane protein (TIGR00698 family)